MTLSGPDGLVELVRLYSNPAQGSARLLRLRPEAVSHRRSYDEPAPLIRQRVSQRLGPELITQIVTEYISGISSTTLTRRYGIGKGTVLRLVRSNGVAVRRRGPRAC